LQDFFKKFFPPIPVDSNRSTASHGAMGQMNSLDLKNAGSAGLPFSGVFLLRALSRRTAKNGKPFLVVEVGDRYGSFTFNIFEDSEIFYLLQNVPMATVLLLGGITETFNDRFSPRVQTLQKLSQKEAHDRGLDRDLYDGPNESVESLRKELDDHIARIGHEILRKTVIQALADVGEIFFSNTAAISMHHAYRCGLLEHSVHVTRAGVALLPAYSFVNADLAIAGMILHDIGKALEYRGDGAYERTRAGMLEGHVVLGFRIVRKAALTVGLEEDLLLQLEHIILSHQGMPEYGAAVLPSSPEGVFVSLVDNLDAKMAMVDRAIANVPNNAEFSEKIPGLENARVFRGDRSDTTRK
jgi:3'-5' exoribonuclease